MYLILMNEDGQEVGLSPPSPLSPLRPLVSLLPSRSGALSRADFFFHFFPPSLFFSPSASVPLFSPSPFFLIVQGFHRTYATGAVCQQRTLTPPDTWSCPTLGLACALMSRPISPELVLSPNFRTSLGTSLLLWWIPLLEYVEIAQLEERKDFDLKIVGSIPLCSTLFLPSGHHCLLVYVFIVWDQKSKWLNRQQSNTCGVHWFETRVLYLNPL